ncbi:MAG: glycosyltransferase [Planctomycetes bacterium]|nr:glycosyltransferase [Planctomycetota bacterium]
MTVESTTIETAPSGRDSAVSASAAPRRRRVLIVVGCYEPCMLADMHRARMLAFDLPKCGWDVEILAPEQAFQAANIVDQDSAGLFAPNVPVHYARRSFDALFRRLTVRSVVWRAWWPMYRLGASLLSSGRFDLVYISTAQPQFFCLGPMWKRRYDIPYVLDFHDPWYRPQVAYETSTRAWRAKVVRKINGPLEQLAVCGAAGLVAVSPHYLNTLTDRYARRQPAWLHSGRNKAIPFAALEHDLAAVGVWSAPAPPVKQDATFRLVHIGGGGNVRRDAVMALCQSLRAFRAAKPELANRLRFELHATTRDPEDPYAGMLAEIARRYDVGDLVVEFPGAVTYRRSLELARDADGLLILGVDDVAYTPSKLFSYLLFGKPVLASLRQYSPASSYLREHPELASQVDFGTDGAIDAPAAVATLDTLCDALRSGQRHDRRTALAEHLSPAMAAAHARLFERCLSRPDVSAPGAAEAAGRSA